MVIGSYVLIITLSVNGLNAPTKRQTGCADENMHMYALPLTTSLCLTPPIACNYFILLGKSCFKNAILLSQAWEYVWDL